MQPFKTFIIRLEENEHSCQMAQDCYDQAVKLNLQPKFFKAIDGKNAQLHRRKENIKPGKKFKKFRPGVHGCFFSHYYLWKQCVQDDVPYIILEHDGYILKNIDNNILKCFDDVLTLDRLDPYSSSYSSTLQQEECLSFEIQEYVNTSAKHIVSKTYPVVTNYFKGAYSYIIKPTAAKKLIKHIAENGYLPADQQINSTILKLNTVIPSLARLHPFYALGNNINSASLTKHL